MPPAPRHRQDRLTDLLVVAVAAAVMIYVLLNNRFGFLLPTPPCIFRTLTGLYCPGCGTRSALLQLGRGNIYAAWRLNPLAVSMLPVAALYVFSRAYAAVTGRSLPRLALPPAAIWAIFAGLLFYWVARNLPFYPFTLMQPVAV